MWPDKKRGVTIMRYLTDQQLNWLSNVIPNPPVSPKGGRPPANKRQVIEGIAWIITTGAKWHELPKEFGSKSTVHRWFKKWIKQGVVEHLLAQLGRCIETRGHSRLYECCVDGGAGSIDCSEAGTAMQRPRSAVRIKVMVDDSGQPIAVDVAAADPHRKRLFQRLFSLIMTDRNSGPSRKRTTQRTRGIERHCETAYQSPSYCRQRELAESSSGEHAAKPLSLDTRVSIAERTMAWFGNVNRIVVR